jgi:hypothetical protein
MQRAMARQAEAERDKRAKVIHAEGEFLCALQNAMLESGPISSGAWARVVGVGLIGHILVELEKWLRRS